MIPATNKTGVIRKAKARCVKYQAMRLGSIPRNSSASKLVTSSHASLESGYILRVSTASPPVTFSMCSIRFLVPSKTLCYDR